MGAYRRAIDWYYAHPDNFVLPRDIANDIEKPGHRRYCTGFYFGRNNQSQCYDTSKPRQNYDFIALVTQRCSDGFIVEMRNRFKVGDELEVLSPTANHNKIIKVERMTDESGVDILDALLVQQKVKIYSSVLLNPGDMLRKKNASKIS